jgi:uncharacterized integral membrane protein
MSYFVAILFIVTLHAVGGTVATKVSKRQYTNDTFLGIAILVAMLVGEVVLLSNGMIRLMEM